MENNGICKSVHMKSPFQECRLTKTGQESTNCIKKWRMNVQEYNFFHPKLNYYPRKSTVDSLWHSPRFEMSLLKFLVASMFLSTSHIVLKNHCNMLYFLWCKVRRCVPSTANEKTSKIPPYWPIHQTGNFARN